ncbi:MAG TPA: EAL domain-containing protein, partial [Solirubrobacteraceae bacterium]|nr:EAL domain-containing protein [Solirubrobacteraceae bacterium]
TDPKDTGELAAGLEDLLTGRQDAYSGEYRFLHAESHRVWLQVSATLVRTDRGEPRYAIVQIQDISERKTFEGQLRYLADHDTLTGLANRRHFEARLDEQVALSTRYGSGGAVLVIDIDHFKYVNDTMGHAVGDDLIARVAILLRQRLRETDVIARLGGDEFAALVHGVDRAHAVALGEQLREHISQEAVVMGESGALRLTASIGVAVLGASGAASAEAVLVGADLAMYQAKERGRDRVEVLDGVEEPQTRMRARLTWADRIRDALAHERFTLHAQPIVDLRTEEITRHELLLRMIGDDGELIPPGSFLALAEEYGLIQAIDKWVIRQAVGLASEHERRGQPLTFEVNLSGASLTDSGVLAVVEEELAAHPIGSAGLVFEVTETAAIINIDQAKRFAGRLAELGCAFALDDFGAGFGSFYYLKHLPFDYMKIDGDFVRELPSSRADQLTIQAIVQIAHGMNKRTIAEFVEDADTVELLRRYGVDYAQGFYVGRPAPLSQLTAGAPRLAPH